MKKIPFVIILVSILVLTLTVLPTQSAFSWGGGGGGGGGGGSGSPNIFYPYTIAVSEDQIFLVVPGDNKIRGYQYWPTETVYDRNSNLITEFGSTGIKDGQLQKPKGIDISENKIKNIEIKVVPIRPVKGQMVCLKMPKVTSLLKHILWRENVYLVPRDNSDLIIGATEEEKGFDKSLTAGGIYNLLKTAREILPGIEDLPIVESWSGLRPATRDEAPIIGPSKKIKGLVYATGHHRNGILLAPLTSNVIKNYYLNGKIENDFNNFKPGRFVI